MIPKPPQQLTTTIPALTTDGARGRVHLALFNPGHWRLLALVVRYGRLSLRDVIVPLEEVAAISDVQVRLRLSRAELQQQPAFRPAARAVTALEGVPQALVALKYGRGGTSEHVLHVPARTALAILGREASPADGLIALRAGQPVWAGAQRVGRLTRLLLDAEGRLRHVVVRTGRLFSRDVLVPIGQVAVGGDEHVRLGLDRAAFNRLPEYRSDRAVKRDVERALLSDDLIRRIDAPTIDVTVSAGVVVLRGHAIVATSSTRAERAARSVPGVLEVVNQIIPDRKLHLAVAHALGQDERTRSHRFRVHVQRGVVVLHGATGGPMMCAAAEAVTGNVPGVRAVTCHGA
jgi:osmotically-inducible protein OsmY